MLTLFVILFLLGLKTACSYNEPREVDINSVKLINDSEHLYQSGDYFFGGQPSVEELRQLQSKGVSVIINLRSEKENESFTESDFNEKDCVQEMGMQYISLSMKGSEAFNSNTLAEFAQILEGNPGKVLIHCYSCYRVTYLFMAWLIEYQNYPLDEVFDFGRKLKYNTPLEGLMDVELKLRIEE